MELLVHHFFDIIRDLGAGKDLKPHLLGHSLHKIAAKIREDPQVKIKIVMGCDSTCEGCSKMFEGRCVDSISHRADFTSKERFNDFIDKKILKACGLKTGEIATPIKLLKKSKFYIGHIFQIYEGNDIKHTQKRRADVVRGGELYSQKFGFGNDAV